MFSREDPRIEQLAERLAHGATVEIEDGDPVFAPLFCRVHGLTWNRKPGSSATLVLTTQSDSIIALSQPLFQPP
ncbi:MAG: hypothetical protein NTZ65_05145 [Candidatus Berkelbacteria bacterium]|nr:hypothetical protein [Candidatus Berkelbacteria bacterium]